jgi:hypothetical protein
MYGMIPTKDNMLMIDNQKIGSIPFDILRANGYKIHMVSAGAFEYCWAFGRACTMHRRIFDTFEDPSNLDMTLISRERWVAEKSGEFIDGEDGPYLLMVNFEGTHYPYSYEEQYSW